MASRTLISQIVLGFIRQNLANTRSKTKMPSHTAIKIDNHIGSKLSQSSQDRSLSFAVYTKWARDALVRALVMNVVPGAAAKAAKYCMVVVYAAFTNFRPRNLTKMS